MNTKKQAKRDANELARATMFYGEGAGNRRKLIQATVQERLNRDPNGYGAYFNRAIGREDMAEHAEMARKERRRIDRRESLEKNTRAVLTGNHQNIRSNLVLLVIVGTALHQTGYDKVALEKAKQGVELSKAYGRRVKQNWDERRRAQKIKPVN